MALRGSGADSRASARRTRLPRLRSARKRDSSTTLSGGSAEADFTDGNIQRLCCQGGGGNGNAPPERMLSRIHRTIADHGLTRPGERVLIAVSGGPDSVAMLVALTRLARRLGIELRAATVDHGLRPEAAGEARAVVQLCEGLGIACEVL